LPETSGRTLEEISDEGRTLPLERLVPVGVQPEAA
jgi:hypothetical protein